MSAWALLRLSYDGTNYINVQVRDAAERTLYAYDSIILNLTRPVRPTLDIVIDDGSGHTRDRDITVHITSSNAVEMRFAINGTTETHYGNWELFATTKKLRLNLHSRNYINVQVRDQDGNTTWKYLTVDLS